MDQKLVSRAAIVARGASMTMRSKPEGMQKRLDQTHRFYPWVYAETVGQNQWNGALSPPSGDRAESRLQRPRMSRL